jgi:hypothetical protein
MATQIVDNGATIQIVNDGNVVLVTKQQIKTIDTIRNNIVRLDIGGGPLHNIFLRADEVNSPEGLNNNVGLRDYINGLLVRIDNGGGSGSATEANQLEQIRLMNTLIEKVTELAAAFRTGGGSNGIRKPLRIDESNAGVIYYGYAPLNSNTSDAVWAIERATIDKDIIIYDWADNNENYDNVWDDRNILNYNRAIR